MPLEFKRAEASFSPNSTDMLPIQLTQMPRSPDLAIFVSTTTTTTTTMTTTTQPIFTPVHAHGVIISHVHTYLISSD